MRALLRRVAVGVLALGIAGPALAQENIDAGKTPAELYAQDCAICHKTSHGLSRAGGLFGLQNFLREHYTASKESAAAIAAYLVALDHKARPPERKRARHAPKSEKSKKSGARLPARKPGEAKAEAKETSKDKAAPKGETKPVEAKSEAKSGAKSTPKAEPKAESKAGSRPKPKAQAKSDGPKTTPDKPEKKTD
jgi:hypothetical protein